MRLFIAVLLNDEMKDELVRMQDVMRSMGVRGNYTRRENLHLTLAFIGEFDDPEKALDVIQRVPVRPFDLKISGTGSFRQLWWAGIDGGTPLAAYTRRLRRALDEAAIPYDRKKFSPHITLIRKPELRSGKRDEEILAAVSERTPGKVIRMTADHASLMRSDRGERGMIYTEIR